jgi:putative transposase
LYDAGNQVKGRKRHLLVDTLGLVLRVVVTAASVSDPAGARLVLGRLRGAGQKLRRIWVDGPYQGTLPAWVKEQYKVVLQPGLREAGQKGVVLLPKRWIVERTFAWLIQYRWSGKDYEQLPASSEALIYVAMIRLMTRRLARS